MLVLEIFHIQLKLLQYYNIWCFKHVSLNLHYVDMLFYNNNCLICKHRAYLKTQILTSQLSPAFEPINTPTVEISNKN